MFDQWFPHYQLRPDPPLLEVLALGSCILVGITLFHGVGLNHIVRRYRRGAKSLLQGASHPWRASVLLGGTILLMLMLHIVDTCIWTVIINKLGLVPDFRTCLYFTANSYTTLGLSAVPLGMGWRELSPIMGISGLFTFAWTTSVMFTIVGYHHDLVEELQEEYSEKTRLRAALRAEQRTIETHLAAEERKLNLAERQQEAGKTFFQRLVMRREEWKQRRFMQDRESKRLKEACDREREQERHLYPPAADRDRKI
jgi:hypothetical protein